MIEEKPMVEDIQNYAQNIVDTVREPLLILDATLRVQSANRAFYQTFHVSPSETEGRLIYELGNGQWDIPDLRILLDQRVRDQQFYTRSLIESNIDALITTDPRGIITDVNKQMEALTGCTRDELIGAPFKDYFTDPEMMFRVRTNEKKLSFSVEMIGDCPRRFRDPAGDQRSRSCKRV